MRLHIPSTVMLTRLCGLRGKGMILVSGMMHARNMTDDMLVKLKENGGVADCYDVSEMGNITLELVRRGYSSVDIDKIWSGNLMRVMAEVQQD